MDDLRAQGIAFFNAGDFPAAIARFREAGAGDLLAHALEASGDVPGAAAEWAAAIRKSPKSWPAYAGLAGLVLRRGPQKGAAEALSRALNGRDKAAVPALRECAKAFKALGDLVSAEKALQLAARLAPKDALVKAELLDALRAREQSFLASGELAPAEKLLRGSLELDPKAKKRLLGVVRARAQKAIAADDLDAAEKALREALALGPDDPVSKNQLAALLRMRASALPDGGSLAPAEKALREAVSVAGDERSKTKLLGVLRRRAQRALSARDYAAAEEALREALALDPDSKEWPRRLAEILRLRAARQARSAQKAALESQKTKSVSDAGLDGAEKTLRKALALAPRDRETRRRLLDVMRRRALLRVAEGDYAAAEKALRKALAFAPGDAPTEEKLKEVLRLRVHDDKGAGRRGDAGRLAGKVLALDPNDARALAARGSVLFSAGEHARGRAVLEKALRVGAKSLPSVERFKALMKVRRYADAFAAAEKILDKGPTLEHLRAFWDPWEWDDRFGRAGRLAELKFLEKDAGGEPSPWLHYYRAELIGPAGIDHFQLVAESSPRRYGWMMHKAGVAALLAEDYDRAAGWFEFALRAEPVDWRAHAFYAETLLCLRRPKPAYAAMTRALEAAPAEEKPQVASWLGAFDLWLGRYAESLAKQEAAQAGGAQCAWCWKGASLLLLGRTEEALAVLDETLTLYPLDFEAQVWRGEAKRVLGRPKEALDDLGGKWLWAIVNRALCRFDLGDEAGGLAECAALPAYFTPRAAKASRRPVPETPAQWRELLEFALKAARGFRREEYSQAIWLD